MLLHSTVLENGLKLYVHEVPHIRTVTLGIWIDQGSKDERDETSGVSHLIEHLMFSIPENGESDNELVRELRAKGARFNATTTREFTYYYISLIAKHLDLGFRTLSTMVRQPEISPAILERERQIVLHEHRMVMGSASQVTERFAQSLWGDEYLGRMVIGREEVIRNTSLGQVHQYLSERYRPDNAGLVVVGGIQFQDAIRLAEEHFGDWRPGAKRARPQSLRYENNIMIIPSDSDEISLCFGVNGVGEFDPDRHAVELLALVLGGSDQSHLFREIRVKRALAYAVNAYAQFFQPGGLVAGQVRCHRKDVGDVIKIMADQFERLRTEPVSEEELTHAREALRTDVFMQTENSMTLMRLIGRNAMLGKNYSLHAHLRAIDAIEAADLQYAAERLFAKRNLALAVVGNVSDDVLLEALSASQS